MQPPANRFQAFRLSQHPDAPGGRPLLAERPKAGVGPAESHMPKANLGRGISSFHADRRLLVHSVPLQPPHRSCTSSSHPSSRLWIPSLAPSLLSVHHGRRPSTARCCRRGIAKLHHVCAPLDHCQCSHHSQQTPNRLLIWYSHDAHNETCSCDVSDALCKLKFRNGGFLSGLTMWSPQRQDGDTKIVGPAYTVQYAPLDDPRQKHPTHYVCSVLTPRGWGITMLNSSNRSTRSPKALSSSSHAPPRLPTPCMAGSCPLAPREARPSVPSSTAASGTCTSSETWAFPYVLLPWVPTSLFDLQLLT